MEGKIRIAIWSPSVCLALFDKCNFLVKNCRLEECFAFFEEVYGDVAAPQNVTGAQLYLFDKNFISNDKVSYSLSYNLLQ